MSKESSVSFFQDRSARHPIRNTMLNRIEITETPETPQAADSTIARFLPTQASMTRDASGVTLRMTDGDELVFGWPMISEARNIAPAKVGK